MLKFGAHAVMNTDSVSASEITAEEIATIIDRDRSLAQKSSALLLKETQQNAADFDAEVPFTEIRHFEGQWVQPEKKHQSFQDMAREWSEQHSKRQAKPRILSVNGYDVLQENNYSMQDGGISVMNTSQAHAGSMATVTHSRRQRAGKDYEHDYECFNCQDDGGTLYCCSLCPAVYHAKCQAEDVKSTLWRCPQHRCHECDRGASEAGGTLFRCIACPSAYCEDHLPATAEVVGPSLRWEALGCRQQSQACYITCGVECITHAKKDAQRRDQVYREGVGGAEGLRAATGTRDDEKVAAAAAAAAQQTDKPRQDCPNGTLCHRHDLAHKQQFAHVGDPDWTGAASPSSEGRQGVIRETELHLYRQVRVEVPIHCDFDPGAVASITTPGDGLLHRIQLPAHARRGKHFERWLPKVYDAATIPSLSDVELTEWLSMQGMTVPDSAADLLPQALQLLVGMQSSEQEKLQEVSTAAGSTLHEEGGDTQRPTRRRSSRARASDVPDVVIEIDGVAIRKWEDADDSADDDFESNSSDDDDDDYVVAVRREQKETQAPASQSRLFHVGDRAQCVGCQQWNACQGAAAQAMTCATCKQLIWARDANDFNSILLPRDKSTRYPVYINPKSPWVEYTQGATGRKYYHNAVTGGKSTWEPPAEGISRVDGAKSESESDDDDDVVDAKPLVVDAIPRSNVVDASPRSIVVDSRSNMGSAEAAATAKQLGSDAQTAQSETAGDDGTAPRSLNVLSALLVRAQEKTLITRQDDNLCKPSGKTAITRCGCRKGCSNSYCACFASGRECTKECRCTRRHCTNTTSACSVGGGGVQVSPTSGLLDLATNRAMEAARAQKHSAELALKRRSAELVLAEAAAATTNRSAEHNDGGAQVDGAASTDCCVAQPSDDRLPKLLAEEDAPPKCKHCSGLPHMQRRCVGGVCMTCGCGPGKVAINIPSG
jgi:hypothetical protein